MNPQTQNPYVLPVAIVIGALIIAGAVMYGPSKDTSKDVKLVKPTITEVTIPAPTKGEGDPYIGKVDAPVTVMYWSDYQCPFCKKFDTDTLPSIVTEYVNTGKVKLVFNDFQFLSPDSVTMAVVSRAVWEMYPDKYFVWKESMSANQGQEHSGYATPEYLTGVLKLVPGIDAKKVMALVEKNRAIYEKEVEADRQDGAKAGINGTPGFLIGSKTLSGALPFSAFKEELDKQLK